MGRRIRHFGLLALVAATACVSRRAAEPPPPPPAATQPPPTPTVPVRDRELELRVARLELRLLEKEAQAEDLQARLDETRREVVRAMAKLQTAATRAEAASGMAEAEIALQAARGSGEGRPDIAQARQLLEMSATEFNRQNYGGALYLANQAKGLAGSGRARFSGDAASLRPNEVPFAVPIRLQAVAQSNVREGPATSFRVVFTVERGTPLLGYSYLGEWVRVGDEMGRTGWMFLTLVGRRESGP